MMSSGSVPDVDAVDACPACGSPQRTFMFRSGDWMFGVPGSFALMRCEACASVFPEPLPTRAGMASYYSSRYYAYAPPVHHRLFDRAGLPARAWYACRRGVLSRRYGYEHLGGSTLAAETIGRLGPVHAAATFRLGVLLHPFVENGALLEIGSGSGSYLDLMRALGWKRVVGVDVSHEAVRQMREVLGIEAYQGDVRDIALASASFDAVSLSHALEHLHDPVQALTAIRRLSKPGARVAIVVPNAKGLGTRFLGRHSVGLDVPRHVVNFSPRGLEAALRRAGLEVVAITTSTYLAYEFIVMGLARRHGIEHDRFSRAEHRFTGRERANARALVAVESAARRAGAPVGELLCAVARA